MLVLALVLVLAACDSGKTRTAPSSGVKTPTAAQLRTALPTLLELPDGFTFSPDQTPEPEISGPTPTECERLYQDFGVGDVGGEVATAAVAFEKSPVGPFLQVGLASYLDETVPAREVRRIREGAQKCAQFVSTDPDGPTLTVKIAAAPSFPRLGDDMAALRLDATGTSGTTPVTMSGYFVIVRVSDALCTIEYFGLSTVDESETEDAAAKAVEKLTTLVR